MRQEQQIFDDLTVLCASPGYVHAIAQLAVRDTFTLYEKEVTGESMRNLFTEERLVRTEISTLIGLLIKHPVDYGLPPPEVVEGYLDDTEKLLEELHEGVKQFV